MSDSPVYGLTPDQRWTLLIVQELSAGGVAPSLDEIAAELDTAKSNVHRYLCCLRERGYITWRPAGVRSIRVLRPLPVPPDVEIVAPSVVRIPHYGRLPEPQEPGAAA